MLNNLPTIGIRLGPGGYGKNILLAYNANHAKLNRSVETREHRHIEEGRRSWDGTQVRKAGTGGV
jgi:hypothetical protein